MDVMSHEPAMVQSDAGDGGPRREARGLDGSVCAGRCEAGELSRAASALAWALGWGGWRWLVPGLWLWLCGLGRTTVWPTGPAWPDGRWRRGRTARWIRWRQSDVLPLVRVPAWRWRDVPEAECLVRPGELLIADAAGSLVSWEPACLARLACDGDVLLVAATGEPLSGDGELKSVEGLDVWWQELPRVSWLSGRTPASREACRARLPALERRMRGTALGCVRG